LIAGARIEGVGADVQFRVKLRDCAVAPEVEYRYYDMVAIDPPIRLDGYPNEPIDSTEAAAKFIERHDGAFDIEGNNWGIT
jgi:hypothetical protein